MASAAEKLTHYAFESHPASGGKTVIRRGSEGISVPVVANAFREPGEGAKMKTVSLLPHIPDIVAGFNPNYNPSGGGPGILDGIGNWAGWAFGSLADLLSMVARGVGIGADVVQHNPEPAIGVGIAAWIESKFRPLRNIIGRLVR